MLKLKQSRPQSAFLRERQYRRWVRDVDRALTAVFGPTFSADDREELRQEAFAAVAAVRAEGRAITNERALLVRAAINAGKSRLRSHDHRRRHSFDPHGALAPVDERPSVEATVLDREDDRRVARLIEQLDDPRQRAVLKLRFELDVDAKTIAAYLGLKPAHTYALLREAGAALWQLLDEHDTGAYTPKVRDLLLACELGTATPDQLRQAAALADDPHTRALLAELRGLGRQAAGVLPLPPVGAAEPTGRIAQVATDVRDHAVDIAHATKQQTFALLGRAPGQEAVSQVAATGGMRGSGSMAIAVAACVGFTGSAAVGVKECIDHGVPAALVNSLPVVGPGNEPNTDKRPESEPVTAPPVAADPPPAPDPVAQTPVTPAPTGQGDQTTTVEDQPEAQPSSEPQPVPQSGADSLSGLSGNPTPAPAPAPAPPPTQSPPAGGTNTPAPASSGTDFGGL